MGLCPVNSILTFPGKGEIFNAEFHPNGEISTPYISTAPLWAGKLPRTSALKNCQNSYGSGPDKPFSQPSLLEVFVPKIEEQLEKANAYSYGDNNRQHGYDKS